MKKFAPKKPKKDIALLFRARKHCIECGDEIASGQKCAKCLRLIREIIKAGGPLAYILKTAHKKKHRARTKLRPDLAAKWLAKRANNVSAENPNAKSL